MRDHAQTFITTVGVLSLTAVAGFMLFTASDGGRLGRFFDPDTRLSFDYSVDMIEAELSDADHSDQLLGRIEPPPEAEQQFLVTVRKEHGGQGAASRVLGASTTDAVIESVVQQYPARFPGFNVENQQTTTIAGVNAAEITFTYDSLGGTIRERLLALQGKEGEIIYLSFQALEGDFATIDEQYFNEILTTIAIK